jgi:Uma2 family endonuclease
MMRGEGGPMPKTSPTPRFETMADLLDQLGGIPPNRVRMDPIPGTATERDILKLQRRTDRLYELVDGVLVEKAMGFIESTLACDLIKFLGIFLDANDLGFLAGPDGAARLMPGLVRIPDISFVAWEQLPKRERPRDPIARLAPALAVEVLSPSNTDKEMERKLKEYFLSGVRVVWLVDPEARTVRVYTAPDRGSILAEGQALDGGEVLPGFRLPVSKVFAEVPRPSAPQTGSSPPTRKRRPKRSES